MESLEVDARKLKLFNGLAKEGTGTVAQNLQLMSDIETEAEVTKLNFLAYDDVQTHVDATTRDGSQVGIYVDLEDPPYGNFLFLISTEESKRLANALLGKDLDVSDGGFSPMQRSAIEEVGNIMTSAFIDGWANVLGTTIAHSPPKFAYGHSDDVLDKVVDWPDGDSVDGLVFVIDGTISARDVELDLVCYNFPELQPLVDLIHDIDVESFSEGDQTAADFAEFQ